jgi:hypothetical protein
MRPCWIAIVAAVSMTACDQRAADDSAPAPGETATVATATFDAEAGPPPNANVAPRADEPADSSCGADKLGAYLNTLPTTDILAKVRAAVGHDRVRTIAPGEAVDADLRPDRLNIEAGVDGRIKRFRCG